MPGGAVVDRPAHARAHAGERVELLDRRVGAVRDDRARVDERPVGVRAVGLPGPEPVGEVAVGRRVRELNRAGDAELREPRQILAARAAARARPDGAGRAAPRPPASARTRRARRGSPRRRSRERRPGSPPRRRRARSRRARSPLVIRTPEPSSMSAVPEPSVPSMNAFRYPIRSIGLPSPDEIPSVASAPTWSAGTDCHTRSVSDSIRSSRCQSRSAPSQPSLSWTAVTPRDAATASPARIASDVHVVGHAEMPLLEPPGRLLAEHAGRARRRRRVRPRRPPPRDRRRRARARPS